MPTRPWPPRVIRQDGSGVPAAVGAPAPAIGGHSVASSAPVPGGGAVNQAAISPTTVGTPTGRGGGDGAAEPALIATRPTGGNARTSRAMVEIARDNGAGSTTTSLVRQARGVLMPMRDRAHGQHAGDGDPSIESGALTLADRQGEIFFVKHTMTEAVDRRLCLIRNRDSERAGSYRLLRQRLVERGDPKVVLVTSARNREGKTTSAANLALAYAEQGHSRVLMIEANFRGPALGEMFGFKPPRCFSVQLERHRDNPNDPWVVVQVAPTDVHVMAVNPNCCPSCSRVLVSGAKFCGDCGRKITGQAPRLDRVTFAASIQRLRNAFDYIIVDGPSVLESADVNLIQDTTDGIVMAARGAHSDARSLKRAIDQVSPAPVLGVALVED